MTREQLTVIAAEAKRFAQRTGHLKFSQGEPIPNMAALLETERAHDPLRQLLEKQQ